MSSTICLVASWPWVNDMARVTQVPRSVTVIPATINTGTHLPKALERRRKVAGYARVSTDSEEQLTSYEAQVDYYTRYI